MVKYLLWILKKIMASRGGRLDVENIKQVCKE